RRLLQPPVYAGPGRRLLAYQIRAAPRSRRPGPGRGAAPVLALLPTGRLLRDQRSDRRARPLRPDVAGSLLPGALAPAGLAGGRSQALDASCSFGLDAADARVCRLLLLPSCYRRSPNCCHCPAVLLLACPGGERRDPERESALGGAQRAAGSAAGATAGGHHPVFGPGREGAGKGGLAAIRPASVDPDRLRICRHGRRLPRSGLRHRWPPLPADPALEKGTLPVVAGVSQPPAPAPESPVGGGSNAAAGGSHQPARSAPASGPAPALSSSPGSAVPTAAPSASPVPTSSPSPSPSPSTSPAPQPSPAPSPSPSP